MISWGKTQHPHYGIEGAFGTQDNGHVLPLALGFPFETTIVSLVHRSFSHHTHVFFQTKAIARLILAGVLDRHPTLPLLLAHSAGALPALSSRLASCVIHDPTVKDRLSHDFRFRLISYFSVSLQNTDCFEVQILFRIIVV